MFLGCVFYRFLRGSGGARSGFRVIGVSGIEVCKGHQKGVKKARCLALFGGRLAQCSYFLGYFFSRVFGCAPDPNVFEKWSPVVFGRIIRSPRRGIKGEVNLFPLGI